jgi:hypothetical protein
MTMNKLTLTLMAAALLGLTTGGCAPKALIHPTASQDQVNRDNFECKRDATQMAYQTYGPNGPAFYGNEFMRECLQSRGYREVTPPAK